MEIELFKQDTLDKLIKASNMLAKSSIVPNSLRNKVEDVFAILVQGAEVGIPPMQALNSISVIQGKPTMNAQLLLALCRNRVKDFSLSISSDPEKISVLVTAKRGQDKFETVWDMKRAQAMGLSVKDNYKKQPLTMLQWRAVSEACRFLCPDALAGFYAKEEFQDFEGKEVSIEPEPNDVDLYYQELKEKHPEQFELGNPEYVIQNGKYRGKDLQSIALVELESYYERLEDRSKKPGFKSWEREVKESIQLFLESQGVV